MRHYIEVFNKEDEEFLGYIKTDLTPLQVAEVFNEHPAEAFELTPETAKTLGVEDLDFEAKEYFIVGAREFENETYEWGGEKLYPPPLFLPDVFNSVPAKPCTEE